MRKRQSRGTRPATEGPSASDASEAQGLAPSPEAKSSSARKQGATSASEKLPAGKRPPRGRKAKVRAGWYGDDISSFVEKPLADEPAADDFDYDPELDFEPAPASGLKPVAELTPEPESTPESEPVVAPAPVVASAQAPAADASPEPDKPKKRSRFSFFGRKKRDKATADSGEATSSAAVQASERASEPFPHPASQPAPQQAAPKEQAPPEPEPASKQATPKEQAPREPEPEPVASEPRYASPEYAEAISFSKPQQTAMPEGFSSSYNASKPLGKAKPVKSDKSAKKSAKPSAAEEADRVAKADTSGFDAMAGANPVEPIDPPDADAFGSNLDEYDAMEQFFSTDSEYASLPHPDIFNAYPIEVQRKIMEWTDRDVRARRDDESRRQDELTRAQVESERRNQVFPTIIIVLAILGGAITGVLTGNPLFPLVFLLVPIAVIASRLVKTDEPDESSKRRRINPPRN